MRVRHTPGVPRAQEAFGGRSVTALLLLFALHAQSGPREGLHAGLADGVAAVLAQAVGTGVEALQGALGLDEHLARVGGQRQFVLARDVLAAGVRLVVTGAVPGVPHQTCERPLRRLELL